MRRSGRWFGLTTFLLAGAGIVGCGFILWHSDAGIWTRIALWFGTVVWETCMAVVIASQGVDYLRRTYGR